jgi:hypothetical protein
MISAAITVTRDDEEIEVYVSGQTEYFGSADWRERGEHLADWSVDEPRGFELTKEECARAEAALERAI